MSVCVLSHLGNQDGLIDFLDRLATLVLEALALPGDTELSILITDDEEIRTLNGAYRGIDRPTDVLSFSMQEGPGPRSPLLGDVVLSVETLARQAVERNWRLEEEAAYLLVHGVLHLLGYDHERDVDADVMEGRTVEIWNRLHPSIVRLLQVV